MSSADQNLSDYASEEVPDGSSFSMGVVVSRWNETITNALWEGCRETLLKHGVAQENLFLEWVPGAFELPVGARLLLGRRKLDAVICLGCVIKGETAHNEYINHAVATGLVNLGLTTGKPVIFGVLTPNDQQQALDRAGGKHGNKGVEAAQTALQMAALAIRSREKEDRSIGFGRG